MEILFVLVLLLIGPVLYFVPTFVAFYRKHPNRFPIFLLNLFLGVTFLGWIAALIWSFTHIDQNKAVVLAQ